jgi:glycosyltransferase involved in cell wall biosynthesis
MDYPTHDNRKKVLILANYYTPGFRGGGPIVSIANIVDCLGDDLDFYVLTTDRDLGSTAPYEGIKVNTWVKSGKAQVYYAKKSIFLWWRILWEIRQSKFDLLYINSFFNPIFSILPLVQISLNQALRGKVQFVLLAPRGEFSPAALRIRSWKKQLYIFWARCIALHKNVVWHASSPYEAADIARIIGESDVKIGSPLSGARKVFTASDLAKYESKGSTVDPGPLRKAPGSAVIGFVSRIAPMKNLEFALKVLSQVKGDVRFEIYGPIEDQQHWESCKILIAKLPRTIVVNWHGEIAHALVPEVLRNLHLLLLPTRGENFGHIISEALSVGCPVLISDKTPWRGLARQGAGWDLPLDSPALFVQAIENVIAQGGNDFGVMAEAAKKFVRTNTLTLNAINENKQMFRECLPPLKVNE